MQVQEVDGSQERRYVIACITSVTFISRAVKLQAPFRAQDANLVFSWCQDHYRKYKTKLGKEVETVFAIWAQATPDKALHARISRLLESLSGEYERQEENGDFLLDGAEVYFNTVRMERLRESLDASKIESSLLAIEGFRRANLTVAPSINVLENGDAISSALAVKQQVLIRYPGAAGEFFGNELSEDSFVAVMAPPKGRKSFILLDIAWRAVLQGKNVAYFQIGDLSQSQILRRICERACRRPLMPRTVQRPVRMMLPPDNMSLPTVEYEERTYKEELTDEEAITAMKRLCEKTGGRIHLSHHPLRTVSVADIRSILEGWDREGWKASCVIIDYAENLAPLSGKDSLIDQTAATWAMLRQLSEIRKCLVVTASQTNSDGFKSWVLTRRNFRNSLMILAHVTGFIGINCTDEEAARGIIRLNWVVRREDAFSETHCLWCASCLDICSPIMLSCLPAR